MTSDSVRFSVEVLLYYAPRFDDVGAALSQASTAAQHRLEGLGSFWGSSWPDEAFAESYRPAQHSLLFTAQQCASDLRQIASRIRHVAHNYGVTEANVTSDINRIGQAASRESRLLHNTGGLPPPPDVPEHTPPPLPRTTPNPTANRPPTPVVAPPEPPKSTQPASPTPKPSPEASPDPNAWKRNGATSFFGPFPTGKPNLIEQAAEAWRDLATALRTAWEDTQHYAAYVLAENEGHAADEFAAHVRRLVDSGKGSLTLTLQGCENTERACWDQAQAIRDLKHQFEELAAEFALTFVIGQVLAAIFAAPTAGGSEAAGQAAEAAEAGGITARATALLRQFIAAVVARMKTVGTALKDLARVLPKAEREASGLGKAAEEGRRLLGDGKTPIKELDPAEQAELAKYREDLAKEDPDLYNELQKDPDHLKRDGTYAIDDGAREEAKTALSLRQDGRVPDDFQRPPERGQGDFYSPSTNTYYDVKEVTSSSNFKVDNFESKLEAQFAKNRTPIIDTRNASQANIDQIKAMIARRGWGSNVIWYP
ncbi:hypothetical protein GCM10029978_106450 [Actinoallomurus acanthiterrae]